VVFVSGKRWCCSAAGGGDGVFGSTFPVFECSGSVSLFHTFLFTRVLFHFFWFHALSVNEGIEMVMLLPSISDTILLFGVLLIQLSVVLFGSGICYALVLAVRFWCYGGDLGSCGDLVFSFVCFWRW
jgi:hypothetical protein